MKGPYISGAEWERMVFGYAALDFPKPRYIPTWEDAIEEVAANQQRYNWNPKEPNTFTGQTLFQSVKSRLKKRFRDHLELYCALGMSLDWDYGTDGFFRINKYIVAVDLTANREKEEASRESDIVVVLAQDVMGRNIGRSCQRIASIFNEGLAGLSFGNAPNVSGVL